MTKSSDSIKQSKLAPLLRPINEFLAAETSGGILLIISAAAALIWANSAWAEGYHNFWHTYLSIGVGSRSLSMSLGHWVNDCLMVLFFLLVGLEIKREVLFGELASARRAALPFAAALGGIIVPASIYAFFNSQTAGAAGWGIPMATDIAFAVGVLALVAPHIPVSLRVFLLAVAIVDDLGAVLVIAIFYTETISMPSITAAVTIFGALVLLNILRVHKPLPYLVLGAFLWLAILLSGVHATVAGVLLALIIPATRQLDEMPYVEYVRRLVDDFQRDAVLVSDRITESQSHALTAMAEASESVQTPLARIEHALLKPVTFIIIPLFALANAGVSLGANSFAGDPGNTVFWGVLFGLLLGKPIGVMLGAWLAVKSRLAALPEGSNWRELWGVGALCGIGFTMSLFVGNLAFGNDPLRLAETKIAVLLGSLVSAIIGAVILKTGKKPLSSAP